MDEKVIINGREYTVYVTENELLAREICAQSFNGYSLKHSTNAYMTKFYKVFGEEKKKSDNFITTRTRINTIYSNF